MPSAIKARNSKNILIDNVVTQGFDKGIDFENSTGVIRRYRGDPISLKHSSAQIVKSDTRGLIVDRSKVELYDTLAWRVKKITSSSINDPVIQDLEYFAQRVIDTRDPIGKKLWASKIKQKILKHEAYLRWLGYFTVLWKILMELEQIV